MSEPTKVEALITNLTLKNDAFAVVPNNGESIYIPPGVAKAADVISGEYRTVTIIPNNPERQGQTKWMGIFVDPPAASMPEAHRSSTEDQGPSLDYQQLTEKLLYVFEDPDLGYLTTAEAAKELDVEVMVARDVLNKLFNERKVARADVHFGSNKRACNVLWAKTPEDFL